jgi:hypothetical protein
MAAMRRFFLLMVVAMVWISLPVTPYAQAIKLEDLIVAQQQAPEKKSATAPKSTGAAAEQKNLRTSPPSGTFAKPAPSAAQQPEKPPVSKPVAPAPRPSSDPAAKTPVQQPEAAKPAVPKPVPHPKPSMPESHRTPVRQPAHPEKPRAPKPAPHPEPPAGETPGGASGWMSPGVIAAIISAVGAIIVAIIGLLSRNK